ncbi:MAG: GTP 3',8-cyclase MoaA [Synergistaceae bacterium]|jgi:cyclic pyranopterin phosphate synthase|nr:GTP 3',8-cyclase MoaA [Synergistaceae bacterium]
MRIIDKRGRDINYARISVTDRCNYRCVYCMPEEGVKPRSHSEIMRFEDILWLSRILVSLGIRHIRFTGGEPLVRRGMADFLVSFREEFPELDISMTTNASLLSRFAGIIAKARLSGMNVSLDTLDTGKFTSMTRLGDISGVMSGIASAAELGIPNIKTNTVVMRGFNEHELPGIVKFSWKLGFIPRMIEFMPLCGDLWGKETFVSSGEIFELLKPAGDWSPERPGAKKTAHGPAKYYTDARTGLKVGVIEAVSNHFCSECNRLRITAAGNLRACLFSSKETPLLTAIRERDEAASREAILTGIGLKPKKWNEAADGEGHMSDIGG